MSVLSGVNLLGNQSNKHVEGALTAVVILPKFPRKEVCRLEEEGLGYGDPLTVNPHSGSAVARSGCSQGGVV